MFALRYFPPRYFAKRYFSEKSADGTGVDIAVPLSTVAVTAPAPVVGTGAQVEIPVSTVTVTAPTPAVLTIKAVVLSAAGVTDITSTSVRPVVDIAYTEYSAGTVYFAVYYGIGFGNYSGLTWDRVNGWSSTPVTSGSEAARQTDGTQTWATTVALEHDIEGYTIAFVWDDGTTTSEIVFGSFNVEYVAPPPEFVLSTWLASFTDDAYTLAGTVQGSALAGTVYAVATLPTDSDPTDAQIVAGQNGGGNPATGAASVSGVTGAFELTVSGLRGELVHHLHTVFEYEEVE